MGYRKTTAVARELGLPPWRLWYLINSSKIPRPMRDDSGDYCWAPEDVERVRALVNTTKPETAST